MPETLVIIPTYNERENVRSIVDRVLSADSRIHVLVVDDNSPDGTGDMADEMAAADERVSVLHRAGKLGLGTAYLEGSPSQPSVGTRTSSSSTPTARTHPRSSPR